MKIGIDGGALSACKNHQFGNYTFTLNLIQAIKKYDQSNNQYILYTFSQPQTRFNFGKRIKLKIIKPKYFWSKFGLSFAEISDRNDVFLAINQSLPIVKAKINIGFSHGLSFYFFKRLYPNSWEKMFKQHQIMLKDCQFVIVSSKKVQNELSKIFPQYNKKIKVLLPGFSVEFKMVKKIERQLDDYFFLAVGMNHPIKNFTLLKKLFIQFKKKYRQYQYKLIFINSGIDYLKIINFYKKATALLTTSLYESFNFPVAEALSVGCPVIGLKEAIIPEFKKYVLVARNNNEFIEKMNKVISQNIVVKKDKLKNIFSWKSYIKELVSLYD